MDFMRSVRTTIGGIGNLMFKQAFLYTLVRDGAIPDVYMQDEKHFKDYKDEIKEIFGEGIGKDDRVSLHIRRGDYFEKDGFYIDLWEGNYYKEAIKHFPDSRFLIFYKDRQGKDDEDFVWCEENLRPLLGDRMDYHRHGEEHDDLNAMASCNGHIMANSSFSWWGSYLGKGKVVCPKKWFSDGVDRVGLLDSWIKI